LQTITARYVVGCDGAHSTVRHATNMDFSGNAYEGIFALGDVEINWSYPHTSACMFLSEHGIAAAIPLKGENRYRFILGPKSRVRGRVAPIDPKQSITLDQFSELLNTLLPFKISVHSARWLSTFHLHHRLSSTFSLDNVFIAGDAAHIHSPVGGQGMNTGIRDALNLGEKLQRVLNKKENPKILLQYSAEREPVAKNIVQGTDKIFRLMTLPETRFTRFFRRYIVSHILRLSFVQKRMIRLMSQLDDKC